jgi:hypothetical protein
VHEVYNGIPMSYSKVIPPRGEKGLKGATYVYRYSSVWTPFFGKCHPPQAQKGTSLFKLWP